MGITGKHLVIFSNELCATFTNDVLEMYPKKNKHRS